ncbi:MAG: DUF2508 family protein [Thermaerobacter sp.]|jgi:hypothetical protein|nr:DUF2508 family protein [Thermaerobacter sp.]MDA8144828.1 DUF2508 family protein [Thermaerobacter sp.]
MDWSGQGASQGVAGKDWDAGALAREACEELENCRRYFESVSDPDLVEQAIFLLNAAERRYVYLLKQARR